MGERVEPKNVEKIHFHDHFWREMFEWGGVVCTPGSFLDGANAPFNIWDVFILATYVQLGSDIGGDGASQTLKFRVTKDGGDPKAALSVDAMNLFEGLEKRFSLSVVDYAGGDKANVP